MALVMLTTMIATFGTTTAYVIPKTSSLLSSSSSFLPQSRMMTTPSRVGSTTQNRIVVQNYNNRCRHHRSSSTLSMFNGGGLGALQEFIEGKLVDPNPPPPSDMMEDDIGTTDVKTKINGDDEDNDDDDDDDDAETEENDEFEGEVDPNAIPDEVENAIYDPQKYGVGSTTPTLTNPPPKPNKLVEKIRSTPNIFKTTGKYGLVPASAALGYFITPSTRTAACIAGSVITGLAGYVTKSKVDRMTEDQISPTIAKFLVENNGLLDERGNAISEEKADVLQQGIAALRDTFSVPADDFAEACLNVYVIYLYGMTSMPIVKTGEIKELERLRRVLDLGAIDVGEAHYLTAATFERNVLRHAMTTDLLDQFHPDRMSMDKLLFLTERVLTSMKENDRAFQYELNRVATQFRLNKVRARDRIRDVATSFYDKALNSAVTKLDTGKVTSELLERARITVGVAERRGYDMRIEIFAKEVRKLLQKGDAIVDSYSEDNEDGSGPKAKGENKDDREARFKEEEKLRFAKDAKRKFEDGAIDRLDRLQVVLGLKDEHTAYEISSEASPLFLSTATSAVSDAVDGIVPGDKTIALIVKRAKELCLSNDAQSEALNAAVSQSLGKILEDTVRFAGVNNEAATYSKILDAMDAAKVCEEILNLAKNTKEEASVEAPTIQDAFNVTQQIPEEDRTKMFTMFVRRSAVLGRKEGGNAITDESYDVIQSAGHLLQISSEQESIVFKEEFGSELKNVLNVAMLEVMGVSGSSDESAATDLTPSLLSNLSKMVNDVTDSYRLSKDLVKEYATPLYNRAVTIVTQNTPSGVPTGSMTARLDALRDLLVLTREDTFEFHIKVFGGVYKKAVLDTMGSTGIIVPAMRKPLGDLRDRLGVSEEACAGLFLEAVEERMTPMVEWIVRETERTMLSKEQLSKKREMDYGEDYFKSGKVSDGKLGLGAEANIMTDMMNLVDFYTENNIEEKIEIGKKNISKKVVEDGEAKEISEEVPDYKISYPINALGSSMIESEMAELLYRQFVVGGFQAQGPRAERIEASRETLGGILGLSKKKMSGVTETIAESVYSNYVTQQMGQKGTLDQQDMMFLANIQNKLGISPEDSERLLLASQKKMLSEEANALLGDDSGTSPEALKAFREKCNSMGMHLEADVGISKHRLVTMFEDEISPALVSGKITAGDDGSDVILEIQESLELTEEEAEMALLNVIYKMAKGAVRAASSEIIRGRNENAAKNILRLVRYAQFVDGELDLEKDESKGWQILSVYEAIDHKGEDEKVVEANKVLLQTALGLD